MNNLLPPLSIGLFSDPHYADLPSADPRNSGTIRHYRASLAKINDCITQMNKRNVDLLFCLGDLIEAAGHSPSEALSFLQTAESAFSLFRGRRYHVIGNHDIDALSKEEFLSHITNSDFPSALPFFSFDFAQRHFVILDSNFHADGSNHARGAFDWHDTFVSPSQISWLRNDLFQTPFPTLAFCHHRLDFEQNPCLIPANAAEVRNTLLSAPNGLLAVIQGHHHDGGLTYQNKVPFFTLPGMIVGLPPSHNGYAILSISSSNQLSFESFNNTTPSL